MTQSNHHVDPIRPGGGLRRLRKGDLGRVKEREVAPTVLSSTQFMSTLKAEIERSSGDDRTLVVVRVRHSAMPGATDEVYHGLSLPAELTERVQSVHENIRVMVISPTELIAFVPALSRRADGEAYVTQLLDALKPPLDIDGLPHHLSPLIGGALLDRENPNLDALVEAARLAADEATASNRIVMFLPYQRVRHQRQEDVQLALRAAILEGKTSVALQPAFDLRTGDVVAFEMLARWEREGRGMVPPVEFVKMAETLGLSHILSRQVLARSLSSVAPWADAGIVDEVTLWLNVTPLEVMHPEFRSTIATAAEVNPNVRIGLELSPSPSVDDRDVHDQLKSLVSRGARLAIGDFGIGAANFTMLQQLPYDSVKLHRNLTRQIAGNQVAAELARLVVGAADALGLETTAQGIEDEGQLAVVSNSGCHIAQGFHFAEPAHDLDELRQLLSIRSTSAIA